MGTAGVTDMLDVEDIFYKVFVTRRF